jgi:hypothetical protein
MQAGRAKKKAERAANPPSPETIPAIIDTRDPLTALREVEWGRKDERELRWACGILDEAKERAATRLRLLADRRTGELCGNPRCGKPFNNQRHFGEISWFDHQAHGIAVLRACSPACYSAIQGISEQIKRDALEREHSRFSHS